MSDLPIKDGAAVKINDEIRFVARCNERELTLVAEDLEPVTLTCEAALLALDRQEIMVYSTEIGILLRGNEKDRKLAERALRPLVGRGADLAIVDQRRFYVEEADKAFAEDQKRPRNKRKYPKKPNTGYQDLAEEIYQKAKRLSKRGKISWRPKRIKGTRLRELYLEWVATGKCENIFLPAERREREIHGDARKLLEIITTTLSVYWWIKNNLLLRKIYNQILLPRLLAARDQGMLQIERNPSFATFRKIAKKHCPVRGTLLKLKGSKKRLLGRAETDSTEMDMRVFVVDQDGKGVVDKDGNPVTARPWLTIVIDVCTRVVLGFYIGLERPSAATVRRVLMQSFWPKSDADRCGAVSIWPFGPPVFLAADLGGENREDTLPLALRQICVHYIFCPPKTPEDKPFAESMMRRVAQDFLAGIKGKTFGPGSSKESEKDARLTLQELRRNFTLWLLDDYHRTRHAGLKNRTPLDVWSELAKPGAVRLLNAEDRLWLGTPFRTQITEAGVVYKRIRYTSSALDATFKNVRNAGTSYDAFMHPDLEYTGVYDHLQVPRKMLKVPVCERDREWIKGWTVETWDERLEPIRAAERTPSFEQVRDEIAFREAQKPALPPETRPLRSKRVERGAKAASLRADSGASPATPPEPTPTPAWARSARRLNGA